MATLFINCLFVDDYSCEDIFKIKIKENETVGNLVEAIKKINFGFGGDELKILKMELPIDTLSDKLAFIESNSFVDIKTLLRGEELPSTKLISECFDTGKHYIVIDPPSGRFTFKKCVNEKKLVVGDKIIYNDNNIYLEGTIVNIFNTFQIKCQEYCLDSFSKFIKLAISPYDIESKHWKNLSIELYDLQEKLIWRDFRRRMLNRNLKGTDLIDPVLEREEKNKAISFEKMAKTEKHDADDIIYNRIRLCPPSIESSTASSKFTTVNATISYGPSADKHVEVEQLYKLLVDKKDCIDRVLESQPVYFIGPSFHEDNNFPCITCWATAPLSESTLEQLGEICGEFKVVCEMLETTNYASNCGGGSTSGEPCEMMEATNYASNNGDGSTSGGSSGPGGNKSNDKKRQRSGKRKSGEDEDKDDDRDYGDNGDGGDGGGGGGDTGGRGSDIKFIKFSSRASAEGEGHVQEFTIRVHIHANIYKNDVSDRILLINADITQCRASASLDQNWKQLSNLGSGYFLDSVMVNFFPITDASNNRSALYEQEYYFPKMKNRIVENSVGTEKQGNLEIGQSPKAGWLMKKSENTKTISDEWHLKTWGSGTTGDYWMYEKRSTDKILQFEPRNHISKWEIGEKMCGFGVKITQVLRFNFTAVGVINKLVDLKPKLVMCPKVSHTLEVNFNGLEDFNEKFMSLEHFRRGGDLILTINNNTDTEVNTKADSGFVNIERSVKTK